MKVYQKKVGFIVLLLIFSFTTELSNTIVAANTAGTLQIKSNIDGANVFMGNNPNGTTDSWGNCNIGDISAGQYTIKIAKVGYKDWIKQIAIDPGKTTMIFPYLESGTGAETVRQEIILSGSVSGSLKVVSIEGVNIYVNDEFGGITDTWGNSQVNGLLQGTYSLRITCLGYKNWVKTINIEPGLTTTVYAVPEPGAGDSTTRDEVLFYNSSYGSLQVNSASDVKVFVSNEYGGKIDVWGSIAVNGLLNGTYTIKLTQSGFKEYDKQVIITAGQTTQLYASLEQGTGIADTRNETLSFDSQFGTLKIKGVDGTAVYIDNEYGGSIDFGACQVNGLIAGDYSLRLTKEGYKDWLIPVSIIAGQTKQIESNQLVNYTVTIDPNSTDKTSIPTINPNDISKPSSAEITLPSKSSVYLNFLIAGGVIAIIAVSVISISIIISRRGRNVKKKSIQTESIINIPQEPVAKYCINCGSMVSHKEEFCKNCGKKV